MSDTNLSAVLHKKGDLRLEERPIPEPNEGEVQLSMRKIGICGSDVKYWTTGGIGQFVVTHPMLLGHECSGVVSKVGKGVTHLKLGDRVAIEPHNICRKCEFCKSGSYNLCKDVFFLATPPDNGALARYHTHAADFVFKLPDNVSFEEGACVEPLSVGLHGCRRAGVTLGSRVLVCGAGPIGLCAMLSAKALGAAAVCMTDIDSKRLEFARKCGATHTLLVTKDDKPEDLATKVADLIGSAPQHTVECSGAQSSVNLGVLATRSGGTMVVIGHGPDNVSFPVYSVITREITLKGSFRYMNTWPTCLEMMSCGKIDVKPLITHMFSLEETLKAFETAKSGEGVKVIIDCEKKG
ncbi:sorbitol dehydrogenase-like isoform X2 [Mizuhopecten yessoensis]|uniref:Sorbitol dehydrogenase n=1 Tax=Mizuhopecten yessoensis TaxID=6573 RepID=A0A210QNB1_MIZYE|nr:sorbitol dehydrogenase-like isoform X1 [Mizuhopecten yessoensis]XP_021354094.1 sorbitol dehydrogenase-like isoform X2 [Mizuhopecten yessoensis]OWF50198.1 Sorbitol dehydrogenase [Mizuhopecten yessoensis]